MMNALLYFEFAISLVIWSWIGYAWWQRRQAGALLVEFEPNQGPSLRPALLVVSLILTGVVLVVGLTTRDVSTDIIARSLVTSAILAGIAAQMFLAPQIRQHGVLIRGDLIRWNTIKRYTWERNTPHELTLQAHTTLRLRATRSIAMPPLYRDKVEAVLAQHIAGSVRVD